MYYFTGNKLEESSLLCRFFILANLLAQKQKSVNGQTKDIRAVTTPVAAPMANDPLKIPRKIPMDLNMAVTSKVWLLYPAGW